MKKCIYCFLLILAACGGGGGSPVAVDPATNSFDSKCHFHQLSGGFPSFDTGNCLSETKSQAKA